MSLTGQKDGRAMTFFTNILSLTGQKEGRAMTFLPTFCPYRDCPVRDNMLVEKCIRSRIVCPVRDKMLVENVSNHASDVPSGTTCW